MDVAIGSFEEHRFRLEAYALAVAKGERTGVRCIESTMEKQNRRRVETISCVNIKNICWRVSYVLIWVSAVIKPQ
jgi:hypothetical protein